MSICIPIFKIVSEHSGMTCFENCNECGVATAHSATVHLGANIPECGVTPHSSTRKPECGETPSTHTHTHLHNQEASHRKISFFHALVESNLLWHDVLNSHVCSDLYQLLPTSVEPRPKASWRWVWSGEEGRAGGREGRMVGEWKSGRGEGMCTSMRKISNTAHHKSQRHHVNHTPAG